jgi:uncharacterized cupredoxin-like copper-binding protein
VKSLILLGVVVLAVAVSGCGRTAAAADQQTIAFHFSKFEPSVLTVPVGVPVSFTLRNDDPIGHEWIVGPPEVHAIHRVGTEPEHEGRVTEVSVAPYQTKTTTVVFDKPGRFEFICHLPGHEAYGMKGVVIVQPG